MKKPDTSSKQCLVGYLLVANLLLCATTHAQEVKPQLLERSYIFEKSNFEACHASTLVQCNDGTLIAAWFGGKYEGSNDVCIWMSNKENNGWTKPRKVADGILRGSQYPCWNPVLFQTRGGKLYLHYKVGPNPREWWAMYKVSNDNGRTWSEAIQLPNGFLGPIKNKPTQLSNGNVVYPSSTESIDEKSWTIHIEISDITLTHWEKVAIDCDTFDTIQPTLLLHPDNKMQLLARSKQNILVQSWSNDDGRTWTRVTPTLLPNPNSGVDGVTLSNGIQLLVYNPLSSGKEWWEGRSVLKLAASRDGIHWNDIYTFEDQKEGEYSYPAIICDTQGDVHITYTDKRTKIRYVKMRVN